MSRIRIRSLRTVVLFSVSIASALVGGAFGAGVVRADGPTVNVNPPPAQAAPTGLAGSRKPAPKALEPAKKLVKVNLALKASNLGAISNLPASDVKLTPMAPRASNGSEIKSAGGMYFYGPQSDEPDGTYTLLQGFPPNVVVRFATEANKISVLDCKVHALPGTSIVVVKNTGGVATVPVDDGHVIHAFQASGAWSEITLMMSNPGTGVKAGNPVGHFYGCEMNKM